MNKCDEIEIRGMVNEFTKKRGYCYEKDLQKLFEDSLEFVMFIVELEEAFSISIDGQLLVAENFSTLERIIKIVKEAESDE